MIGTFKTQADLSLSMFFFLVVKSLEVVLNNSLDMVITKCYLERYLTNQRGRKPSIELKEWKGKVCMTP
jgi:hypothetical protein